MKNERREGGREGRLEVKKGRRKETIWMN